MYWFSISHHGAALVVFIIWVFWLVCLVFFCLMVSTLDFLSCETTSTAPVVVEFRWDETGIVRSRNTENPKDAALHRVFLSLLSLLL